MNKSHPPTDFPPHFQSIRAQRQDAMDAERMFFNIHQYLPLKESSGQRFPRMQNKRTTILPGAGKAGCGQRAVQTAHRALASRPSTARPSRPTSDSFLNGETLRNFSRQRKSPRYPLLLPPKAAAHCSDFFHSFLLEGAALAKGGTRFPHLRGRESIYRQLVRR